jgi:hypothetical protein
LRLHPSGLGQPNGVFSGGLVPSIAGKNPGAFSRRHARRCRPKPCPGLAPACGRNEKNGRSQPGQRQRSKNRSPKNSHECPFDHQKKNVSSRGNGSTIAAFPPPKNVRHKKRPQSGVRIRSGGLFVARDCWICGVILSGISYPALSHIFSEAAKVCQRLSRRYQPAESAAPPEKTRPIDILDHLRKSSEDLFIRTT